MQEVSKLHKNEIWNTFIESEEEDLNINLSHEIEIVITKPIDSQLSIIDNLYLGSAHESRDQKSLISLGIKHILVVGIELKIEFPELFEYKKLNVFDYPNEDIGRHFEQSHQFIKEGINKGGCLVHCAIGKSRSPTIIISYLMKENNLSFLDSYHLVKSKRPKIKPNIGFLDQLTAYEEYLNKGKEIIQLNMPKEKLDCWVEI